MRCPALIAALVVSACADPTPPSTRATTGATPLVHEAYVWQRRWTPAVEAAVERPPAAIAGLRVLAAEVEDRGAPIIWPAVSPEALARSGRPVTAVVRIDGSRPIADLDLGPLGDRLAAWRGAGVAVAGVEIDHDCATAALGAYAAWLAALRRVVEGRLSITALPTWARSPELSRVAAAVDELVVQVHAIRAPTLFDPATARRWVEAFAGATKGRPVRVALPTYQIALDGRRVSAEPPVVGAFVRELERARPANVSGILWFRLPVETDGGAWPAPTLAAVIAGEPVAPAVAVSFVARGAGRGDLVLANRGNADAPWPAIAVSKASAADLVGGYRESAPGRWAPPAKIIRPGDEVVVGWATGREVTVNAR